MTKADGGYPTPDLRADIVDRVPARQLFVGAGYFSRSTAAALPLAT